MPIDQRTQPGAEESYEQLRAIAHRLFGRMIGHTLQPTELVHEAYVKIEKSQSAEFESEGHYIAVATRAMRQVLVDHSRKKASAKRGSNPVRVTLSDVVSVEGTEPLDLLALDRALSALSDLQPRQARVVELKFFGGLSIPEIGEALSISTATVEREWRRARAWLLMTLDGEDEE